MASFTVGDGTGSDQAAAEMARLIRGKLTPEQKRNREQYAATPEEDPETKNSRELLEILENANKTNEKSDLDYAIGKIMDFKERYYVSQSSKFRGKNAKKLTELEKIIEDKMDDFDFADVHVTQWTPQLSKWRYSSDSDDSSSGEEAGAGASNVGGRRRRRKSRKRKIKKKKKTRKKRKKRKTRKKRKLRKKKKRKTNRK